MRSMPTMSVCSVAGIYFEIIINKWCCVIKISYIQIIWNSSTLWEMPKCVQPDLKLNFYSKLEIDLESYGLKCGKYKLQKDLPQHLITFLKRE